MGGGINTGKQVLLGKAAVNRAKYSASLLKEKAQNGQKHKRRNFKN